jgi:hypothetical protein
MIMIQRSRKYIADAARTLNINVDLVIGLMEDCLRNLGVLMRLVLILSYSLSLGTGGGIYVPIPTLHRQ